MQQSKIRRKKKENLPDHQTGEYDYVKSTDQETTTVAWIRSELSRPYMATVTIQLRPYMATVTIQLRPCMATVTIQLRPYMATVTIQLRPYMATVTIQLMDATLDLALARWTNFPKYSGSSNEINHRFRIHYHKN